VAELQVFAAPIEELLESNSPDEGETDAVAKETEDLVREHEEHVAGARAGNDTGVGSQRKDKGKGKATEE
jgi:hypothetical protein